MRRFAGDLRITDAAAEHVRDRAALTLLLDELERAEWVVDALFGTGLSGPVRPPFDQVIVTINASGARVLAVDIPSGLDADTGLPLGWTVTVKGMGPAP